MKGRQRHPSCHQCCRRRQRRHAGDEEREAAAAAAAASVEVVGGVLLEQSASRHHHCCRDYCQQHRVRCSSNSTTASSCSAWACTCGAGVCGHTCTMGVLLCAASAVNQLLTQHDHSSTEKAALWHKPAMHPQSDPSPTSIDRAAHPPPAQKLNCSCCACGACSDVVAPASSLLLLPTVSAAASGHATKRTSIEHETQVWYPLRASSAHHEMVCRQPRRRFSDRRFRCHSTTGAGGGHSSQTFVHIHCT